MLKAGQRIEISTRKGKETTTELDPMPGRKIKLVPTEGQRLIADYLARTPRADTTKQIEGVSND